MERGTKNIPRGVMFFWQTEKRYGDVGESNSIDIALVAKILLGVWLALFVYSRYSLYQLGLGLASDALRDSRDMARICQTHNSVARIEREMCSRHIAQSRMSDHWWALEYVKDNTYMCGYDSCGNVFGALFTQVGLVAACAIVVLALIFFVVTRYIGLAATARIANHHQANYWENSQPRFIEQGDSSHTTAPFSVHIEEVGSTGENNMRQRRAAIC